MHVCVCVAKPVAVKLRCHATALIFSFMDTTDSSPLAPGSKSRTSYKIFFLLLLFFSYVINHIKRTGTIQGRLSPCDF